MSYNTSNSINVGVMHVVAPAPDNLQIGGCPAMSWSAMWEMLESRAVGFRENARSGLAPSASASANSSLPFSSGAAAIAGAPAHAAESASSNAAPLRSELRGNALRQALSTAARASDLNV
eukprot:4476040-Pleurochrysis_carterae.AAC.1